MSELEDALDKWETWLSSAHGVNFDYDTMLAIITINEAARRYANPNMQAAGDKYLEWIGYMTQKGYITINKPMADQDPQHLIVAAALTPGDTR